MYQLGRQIRKSPQNANLCTLYRFLRKQYKKKLRQTKANYENNLLSSLEASHNSNPRAFWETYKQLKHLDEHQKTNPISVTEWTNHFSKLFNQPVDEWPQDKVLQDQINQTLHSTFNELNFTITDDEILQAVGKLKLKKACGKDLILNEMLKSGITFILPSLNKVFNKVLVSGIFPDNWRSNVLTPLHKKGDSSITNNYRGIAVCSNFCKLFCSILHNRLTVFVEQNKLIPNNQIGYKKKSRTSDHILTLKNLIDKYVLKRKGNKLFACFVDFKSAFDTVWRNALFQKLLNSGIGGTFLKIIIDMYKEVSYCVKIDSSLSKKITSNIGVKQGCVLSPTLFNLYLSDFPNIFDDTCKPVTNFHNSLNCLMFADDIVLLSETADGLQNCLNNLKTYCCKWALTVNTLKTKVMIFNKGGRNLKNFNFTFGNETVETCQHYTYLGITFSACGTFTKAINEITGKALKVFYKLRQLNTRDNALLTLKLFDSLVSPIISYGCEVWSPYLIKNLSENNILQVCDKCVFEKINVKLCKYILGVRKFATNAAVRGELGRFPLLIKMLPLAVKFWSRTCTLDVDNIVKISYLDSVSNFTGEVNNWPSTIHHLLSTFHMDTMWEEQFNTESFPALATLKYKLKDTYSKKWLEFISRSDSNKLRNYARFKKSFEMENYVKIQKCRKRQNFTKLRISCHRLAIETGRYTRPITPNQERFCIFCNNASIEDESHLLFDCSLYENERQKFFTNLSSFCTFPCNNTDTEVKFSFLMNYNSGDTEIANAVCKFVDICFNQRYFVTFGTTNTCPVDSANVEFLRLSNINHLN